jgi:hypothetical protein
MISDCQSVYYNMMGKFRSQKQNNLVDREIETTITEADAFITAMVETI